MRRFFAAGSEELLDEPLCCCGVEGLFKSSGGLNGLPIIAKYSMRGCGVEVVVAA
jgi:hypothetical protein